MKKILYSLPALMVAGGTFLASPSYAANDEITVSWDQQNYSATTDKTFFGVPVTVPGDTDTKTLYVKNDGPCPAKLTATIVNVDLKDIDAKDIHHNPNHKDPDGTGTAYTGAGNQGDFYSDLLLRWKTQSNNGDASFKKLLNDGTTTILETNVPKGKNTPIQLTYDFPWDAYSGNTSNVSERKASFTVHIKAEGNCGNSTSTTSTPPPSKTSTAVTTPPPTKSSSNTSSNTNTTSTPSKSTEPSTDTNTKTSTATSTDIVTPKKNNNKKDDHRIFTDNKMDSLEWLIIGGIGLAVVGTIIIITNNRKRNIN